MSYVALLIFKDNFFTSHIDIIGNNGWLTTSISLITRITIDCLLAWNSSTVCCSCGRKSSRFLLAARCLTEHSLGLQPSLDLWISMKSSTARHTLAADCKSSATPLQSRNSSRPFPFNQLNYILKKRGEGEGEGEEYYFLCRKVSARAWLMIKVRRKRAIHEERGGLQYLRNQFSRTLNIKNMATQLNTGTCKFSCMQTSSCLMTNLIGVLKSRNMKHICLF